MGNTVYKDYCTGCGLCENDGLTKLIESQNGFLYSENINGDMIHFCTKVCPANNSLKLNKSECNIWGEYKSFFGAYSSNSIIRKRASSGGVLTTICCWLLENQYVDGIIQTKQDASNPTDTITVISRTAEDVIECSGSRYSRSAPLRRLNELLVAGEKYAFVGKPCDVYSLSKYMELKPQLKDYIIYKFSFFCAGTPSPKANRELIRELGIKSEVKNVVYRGDGWPGFTKAEDKNGNIYKMTYQKSWMEILGRDVRLSCKFCFDSIGEYSDVSCGDLWYLSESKEPDFSEHEGRNCVFTWSKVGEDLMNKIIDDKELIVEEADIEELKYAQPNHYNRRSTMISRILIMKLFHKNVPNYNYKVLLRLAKYSSLRAHLHVAKGTFIRIKRGRI